MLQQLGKRTIHFPEVVFTRLQEAVVYQLPFLCAYNAPVELKGDARDLFPQFSKLILVHGLAFFVQPVLVNDHVKEIIEVRVFADVNFAVGANSAAAALGDVARNDDAAL